MLGPACFSGVVTMDDVEFLLQYARFMSDEWYDRWQAVRHVVILQPGIATGIIFVPDQNLRFALHS